MLIRLVLFDSHLEKIVPLVGFTTTKPILSSSSRKSPPFTVNLYKASFPSKAMASLKFTVPLCSEGSPLGTNTSRLLVASWLNHWVTFEPAVVTPSSALNQALIPAPPPGVPGISTVILALPTSDFKPSEERAK